MFVAPFVAIAALLLLCLSPLALPVLPFFLIYWIREKRAGRTVTFRWQFGNADDEDQEVAPSNAEEQLPAKLSASGESDAEPAPEPPTSAIIVARC